MADYMQPRSLDNPRAAPMKKGRQRPWARKHARDTGTKWAAGEIVRKRDYFGQGVSKPRPQTALAAARRRSGRNASPGSRSATTRKGTSDQPQYSVKYVGVSNGEMGVLSRRVVMPTTTTRMPKSAGVEHKPRYRMDPNMPLTSPLRRDMARPVTAPATDNTHQGLEYQPRHGDDENHAPEGTSGSNRIARPGSAPSVAQGRASRIKARNWSIANEESTPKETQPLPDKSTVPPIPGEPRPSGDDLDENRDNDVEEENYPNPDKYDRGLISATPPRPALSAGRARVPAPNILPLPDGMRNAFRPESAPAYILSTGARTPQSMDRSSTTSLVSDEMIREHLERRLAANHRRRPATVSGGAARPMTLHRQRDGFFDGHGLAEEESLSERPVPFVIHQRVRGWKLTSPYTAKGSSVLPANVPVSASVRHERLTADDIMQQHHRLIGDPSLLQSMIDPLAQVVEEEKRSRVRLRQTNAVMETFERWQRGRATKPWRSGHHWDEPHPEVPFEPSTHFRSMSSTPSAYAAMVRASTQDRAIDEEQQEARDMWATKLSPVRESDRVQTAGLAQENGDDDELHFVLSHRGRAGQDKNPIEPYLAHLREKSKSPIFHRPPTREDDREGGGRGGVLNEQ